MFFQFIFQARNLTDILLHMEYGVEQLNSVDLWMVYLFTSLYLRHQGYSVPNQNFASLRQNIEQTC
jgi:hypothetical protein